MPANSNGRDWRRDGTDFQVDLEVLMKKYLILILCATLIVAFGCSANAADTVVSPEPVVATPAPLGGDSTVNGKRNATDGHWLYYYDFSDSYLYRVDATLENAERVSKETSSDISLDGDEAWFWDWKNQLHHLSANDMEQVVFDSEGDIAASWLYEGSLYYLEEIDYDTRAMKRLDLNSMKVTELIRTTKGENPSIIASAGHIFFTEAIDEMSFADKLYRTDLDGTNRVQISDHAYDLQLLKDKLYYRNENGLWVHNVVNGRTKRVRDGLSGPYTICDGMIYYNNYSGESTQLVCAPLYGGKETDLLPGHEADSFIVVLNGMIYFDEYKPNADRIKKYYIGALTGKEATQLYYTVLDQNESDVKMPNNPFTNQDSLAGGTSWLYLEASETLSACYRLYDTNGTLVQQVLLGPNEGKTISFPSGYYVLKIAEGTNWINDNQAFGPDGKYSSTSDFGFEAGGSYRIGSGNRGDFYGTDQSGF